MRGYDDIPSPSPLSSPVEGEEVRNGTVAGIAAFTCLSVLFALLDSSAVNAQTAREKIRVALGAISANTAVIPVARDAGIFAKYNLDVEPIYIGGGINSLAALTSGDVQFLHAGTTATISARLGGADVMILAVQSNRFEYMIFASPEIKSAKELKGKKVTGTRPGAAADTAMRLFLRKAGLEPDKDVTFISVAGSQQGRLSALQSGFISATPLAPPFSSMAREAGFTMLADMRKQEIQYAGSSVAAMGPYIKTHADLVERFLKGYVEGTFFYKTNKEETLRSIMKYMRMSDRARAEEGRSYYAEIMPDMPYATPEGIQAVLDFLAVKQTKAASMRPREFFDMSVLKKIEESGFLKSLHARR